jgi:hypothetical protein
VENAAKSTGLLATLGEGVAVFGGDRIANALQEFGGTGSGDALRADQAAAAADALRAGQADGGSPKGTFEQEPPNKGEQVSNPVAGEKGAQSPVPVADPTSMDREV